MSKLNATKSEDVLSAKVRPVVPLTTCSSSTRRRQTDLCVSNAIVKAGTALGVGIIASAILFKRRPWPVLLGLGFGIGQSCHIPSLLLPHPSFAFTMTRLRLCDTTGQGYSDCERIFNPAAVPGFTIVPSLPSASPSLSKPSVFSSIKQEIVKDVKLVKEQVIGTVNEVKHDVVSTEKAVVSAVKAEEKKWV